MRSKLGRFLKGLSPWNKGKKDFRPSPETEFKAGPDHTGENHPSWNGGEQVMSKDCVYVWTGNKQRARRPREIYKQHYGEIPKGYVVIHLDGNPHNDDPTNLKAISRAENLARNVKQKK
jgi:HNH endonuclease